MLKKLGAASAEDEDAQISRMINEFKFGHVVIVPSFSFTRPSAMTNPVIAPFQGAEMLREI